MKALLVAWFPVHSMRGWIVRGYANDPFRFSLALGRSFLATFKMTKSVIPLSIRIGVGQRLITSRGKNAKLEISGAITVAGWGGSYLPSSLILGDDSCVRILGNFMIGPNVHISTRAGAEIEFGGESKSSGSGITCNSRIMAENSIKIGADAIMAWDVLVTDSDWHRIERSQRIEAVEIGDSVWIAHGVSVLKGSFIPSGSIVGAKSLVQAKFSGKNLLLAGTPARVIREGVQWER